MIQTLKRLLTAMWKTGVVATFLTGLFALLPVIVTVLIMQWLIGQLSAALGPGTFLGDLITSGGMAIVGEHHQSLAFVLGVALVLVAVWFVGFLLTAFARNRVVEWLDQQLASIPVVRAIYRPVAQVVRLMRHRDANEQFARMTVVLCRFGGPEGAEVLALLPSNETWLVDGIEMVMVYLPSSPLPMTGALTMVPRVNVKPIEGLEVEDLMKVYFSFGVLTPETLAPHLPRAGGAR